MVDYEVTANISHPASVSIVGDITDDLTAIEHGATATANQNPATVAVGNLAAGDREMVEDKATVSVDGEDSELFAAAARLMVVVLAAVEGDRGGDRG
ncbi:hypothetical protein HCB39_29815 [Salinispora arenicola]|nr:hypothetical protein [Salinispora arenicola]